MGDTRLKATNDAYATLAGLTPPEAKAEDEGEKPKPAKKTAKKP